MDAVAAVVEAAAAAAEVEMEEGAEARVGVADAAEVEEL